uniref:Peptidase C45 acyl-coenzyme A:6-aminopenicillanic acid acyl-transferase n=2 Tax=Candidatus Bipolaricaulota TaxID=67810 RepID=H5SKG8_9BACT|nr:peptidase C45 acyl-coenzyme A:6-aminopenicillanic acid acyl-transferase [uncultured Acetothermia bacterium]BAL59323.1 peptidase C45 acyl-coenzyme A:6-aminopenicillanic acid acyl-transferase [Candidatus Acetothermum autotrophicum]
MTTLPVLELEGTPYEQGLAHGKSARELIAQNIEIYFYRFERETKLPKAEVLRRAGLYLRVIEKHAPHYAEAMRGVAEGSQRELLEIAALNARYELIYSEVTKQALTSDLTPSPSLKGRGNSPPSLGEGSGERSDGCTSFAVLPQKSTNKHLLLAENWDWIPDVRGVVLKICEPGMPEILCFTEAGIVGGKIGLNSAGLGLAINGLNSEHDNWAMLAKPFHVRCWEVLRCTDFDRAVRVVTEGERGVSANFLIAQAPDRVVDLETAPTGVATLFPQDGWLAHTNHFINPHAVGLTREVQPSKRPSTKQRLARVQQLLRACAQISLERAKEILRDHEDFPYSLCRHPDENFPPEERYASVVSVVMDLHDKTLMIASGPPCQHEYRVLKL